MNKYIQCDSIYEKSGCDLYVNANNLINLEVYCHAFRNYKVINVILLGRCCPDKESVLDKESAFNK
jgi:hypothetical protein